MLKALKKQGLLGYPNQGIRFLGSLEMVFEHKDEQVLLCKEHHEKIKKTTYEKEEEYESRINELKGQIEFLCKNTEDFETRLFNARLEEIRIEIQKVKEERDKVIPSYLVRSMRSKKASDMLQFLEENERLEDEEIFAAIESMVDEIIVIDNDLPGESINVYLYNGETYKIELNNNKKRRGKRRVCYREESE